ncbi:MAG: hypothetical protein WAX04_03145 [Oscillospiraceae bacterium]
MDFLTKIRNHVQVFMYGRNGFDILSRDLNLFGFFLMLLDSLFRTHVIYWIGMLLFLIAIYRICSRNIAKRSAENRTYVAFRTPIIQWFKNQWQQFSNRKYYCYYKCSSCSQKLRVPKGKGKIEVTCPKCGKRFIKKT